MLPRRSPESSKGDYGKLLMLCGSRCYTGAAVLAALGALRSGVGLLCAAAIPPVAAAIAASLPSCTFLPLAESEEGTVCAADADMLLARANASTACLMGCGLGRGGDVETLVRRLVREAQCPLILDADALNAVAGEPQLLRDARHTPIVTPHVGEMSRLTGFPIAEIKANRVEIAAAFARQYQCTVALKDHITAVTAPDGRLWLNTTGNAGLARGGSGDFLAGIIASFVAQGVAGPQAALCGVYLHGLAADRCAARLSQYGMLPQDLADDLCTIFLENGR